MSLVPKIYKSSYPEVVHRHGERVEHLGVNLVVLKIDEVHLLTDLLQSCLRAQRSQVSAHVAVRFCSDLANDMIILVSYVDNNYDL